MGAHIRAFSAMGVQSEKVWRPLASRMLYNIQLLAQSHILLLNSFFNINMKYSPQQYIFNMPTEMFFLQNINGDNDTMETFEGSGLDNRKRCWQSILWWNYTKVTAVKLKHVQLLNQIRALLFFLHLPHFSSVPDLHHPLSLFPISTLRKHPPTHSYFFDTFIKALLHLIPKNITCTGKKKRE